MLLKRNIIFFIAFFVPLVVSPFAGLVWADAITPAQEQEFIDARGAVEAARKAESEKYSPTSLNQAEEFLTTAGSARSAADSSGFSRASRLARVYAELAKATAELGAVDQILADTQAALLKAKAEIDQLKR